MGCVKAQSFSCNAVCIFATKQVVCTAASLYLAEKGKALYVLKQERVESQVTGLQNGVKRSADLEDD